MTDFTIVSYCGNILPAFTAYVDPSVMSYTIQAVAGVVIACGVVFGVVWRRVKRGAKKVLNIDENAGKEVEEEVQMISPENENGKTQQEESSSEK